MKVSTSVHAAYDLDEIEMFAPSEIGKHMKKKKTKSDVKNQSNNIRDSYGHCGDSDMPMSM